MHDASETGALAWCVGAVSTVSLGTALVRGGTTTAASGWRLATLS